MRRKGVGGRRGWGWGLGVGGGWHFKEKNLKLGKSSEFYPGFGGGEEKKRKGYLKVVSQIKLELIIWKQRKKRDENQRQRQEGFEEKEERRT